MRLRMFGVLLVYIVTQYNIYAQKSYINGTLAKCDLPTIAIGFESQNGVKYNKDTAGGLTSLLDIDTAAKTYVERLECNSFNYYHYNNSVGTELSDISIRQKKSNVIVFFNKDYTINQIIYQDSCTETEIDFGINGRILAKYYCDYSKPDSCYSEVYNLQGSITSKTFYVPFCYSNVVDKKILERYMDKKAIPIKRAEFDSKGNKLSQYKIDNK